MRAAVYHGRDEIRIEDIPVPEVGPRDAMVEVDHCGICGSDLHMVFDGWGRPGSTGGHEYSGRIVALGSDVGGGWQVGDAVVGGPGHRCGRCELCRSGRPSLCLERPTPGTGGAGRNGAFARYVVVDESELVRLPEGLPLRVAALTEPLSVAVHAVGRSGASPGSRVLVTGAGPIGLLVIAVLRAYGVEDVVVCEPAERRRALALGVGARSVLPAEGLSHPRMPMELVAEPFDAAIECSGKATAQEAALGQLGRAGTLVLVGAGMDRPRFEPNRILLNELVVTGSNEYASGDYERSLDLLSSGRLPTGLLIEEDDVGLEGLLGAMRSLAAGELPGKVMVAPGMEED
jgi:(R,R)-butanediol dehydrogenase/meso-butanediol dehydrogenase/diacetyl reductase